jgi:excisionase family DNA binding protein
VEKDYLTVTEAAKIAGCQRGYLYSLIADEVFETKLIGGRRFVLRSSFKKWSRLYQIRRHVPRSSSGGSVVAAIA